MKPAILSEKLCGPYCRFKLTEFRTRFGTVEWHLADAEVTCPLTGLPEIVYQGNKFGALQIIAQANAEEAAREKAEGYWS